MLLYTDSPLPAFAVPSSVHLRSTWLPQKSCPIKEPQYGMAINRKVKMTLPSLAVMVNGLPGGMATAVAKEVLSRGLTLVPEALTGPGAPTNISLSSDSKPLKLVPPADHESCVSRIVKEYQRVIAVDYTHPGAAAPNAQLYSSAGLSFVVGTTGGDTEAMRDSVKKSPGVYAVLAPNMGKQIVAFQAMMAGMAREFPGAFSGYTLTVTESHQSGKKDTSGTAKAVVESFRGLGVDFDIQHIRKIREPHASMSEMGVPGEFVTKGHAFHTYTLTSPDGTVVFEFKHNVCGRALYASGTVDAVQWLDKRKAQGGDQRIFDMIDILRSGAML